MWDLGFGGRLGLASLRRGDADVRLAVVGREGAGSPSVSGKESMQVLSAVRTDAPERPVGLDAGIWSLANLLTGERLERRRQPAERIVDRRKHSGVSGGGSVSKNRVFGHSRAARYPRMDAVTAPGLTKHWSIRTITGY